MRDGNQLERMYAVSFKVPSEDQLEDEKDEDEKKISRRFEGGQMLLHVAQSSTYTGLAIGKLGGNSLT
jgi:hypothetical protein